MEISKDALMRVVKAARVSLRLAEDMSKLLVDKTASWADMVSWYLEDALCTMVGESVEQDGDFLKDSQTIKILNSQKMSDDEVTDALIDMYRQNCPEQPKPHFINRDEMRKQAEAGCGYIAPGVCRV